MFLAVAVASASVVIDRPAAAAPSAPLDICADDAGRTCSGAAEKGQITWEIRDGGIVLRATAASGTTWRGIAVCIPGSSPTSSDDCDASSAGVLDPSAGDFTVSGVTGAATSSAAASFDCSTTVDVTIPRETLQGLSNPIPWTVQLANCGGSTDEAFGESNRGTSTGTYYRCSSVTNLTATSATLSATTNDTSVDWVEFKFHEGSTASYIDDDLSDGISVDVTGLQPNTVYLYHARFFDAEDVKRYSQTGCKFATPKGRSTSPTYLCLAPTNVTETAATLRGSTTDGEVTSARFAIGSRSVPAVRGSNGNWTARVEDLEPSTEYSYRAIFSNGSTVVASSPVCSFSTVASTGTTTTSTSTTSTTSTSTTSTTLAGTAGTTTTTTGGAVLGDDQDRGAVVQGVTVSRGAPEAVAAVQGAPLARSGIGLRLALVGLILVAIGTIAAVVSQRTRRETI